MQQQSEQQKPARCTDPCMLTKAHFPILNDQALLAAVTVSAARLPSLKQIHEQRQNKAAASESSNATDSVSERRKLLHALDTHGFAIVTDVFGSPAEIQQLQDLFRADLRSLIIPEKSNDKELLKQLVDNGDPIENWPLDEMPLGSKFATDFGLPQGRAAWAVRLNERARRIWASIHGTSELCVSTDAVFFTNRVADGGVDGDDSKRQNDVWPHTDINIHASDSLMPVGFKDEGCNIYQGVLFATDCTHKNAATTVVWPGSHRGEFERLMNFKDWRSNGHFCRVWDGEHLADFIEHAVRVPVPAGAMLVWNSKLLHQSWSQGKRLAFAVCYEPKSRRVKTAFPDKLKAVVHGGVTTHWASLGQAFIRFENADGTAAEIPEARSRTEGRLVCAWNGHRHFWASAKSNGGDGEEDATRWRRLEGQYALEQAAIHQNDPPASAVSGLFAAVGKFVVDKVLPEKLGGSPVPSKPLPQCVVDLL